MLSLYYGDNMAVGNMTLQSKIILSKLLLHMMQKVAISNEEINKSREINSLKKKLRGDYSELQEKYAASLINGNELREEIKLYNYKLKKLELEYHEIQSSITAKELYYKRLEILHNILNNDHEETFIETDHLYQQLLENIKDEVIKELEAKLDSARLVLQLNIYSKELSKENEHRYRDQIYDTQLEIQELKKVLKIDKLDMIKEIPLDKLVNDGGYSILEDLYKEDIYGQKDK